MASTRDSPMLVDQPSSHPSHTLPAIELPTPSTAPETSAISETVSSHNVTENSDSDVIAGRASATRIEQEGADGPPPLTPAAGSEETAANEHDEEDNSSNSESRSDSSTSTETPGTISTPRSSAHDSGQPVPDGESAALADSSVTATNDDNSRIPPPPPPGDSESQEALSIPPPPVAEIVPVPDPLPSWVLYEEDTSEPNAEELKRIETNGNEINASDPNAVEKDVFYDVDDPDQRPCKKIRLSWVIKGVRGNKEKPNRARIMTSPSVCIDGKYWNLKFFPRGNKSRNSLAVFLRCSPGEPLIQSDGLVGSFRCWEGAHDADLSTIDPIMDQELKLPEIVEKEDEKEEPVPNEPEKDESTAAQPESSTSSESSESIEERSHTRRRDNRDDDDSSSVSDDQDDHPLPPINKTIVEDFRLSAQLGLAVYNPAEPRTCYTSSASHQFYPHQDDWGWDTAVSYWEDIHTRRSGQRQALLRDDTLAVDAYIRIYDDPTKALYWHSSPGETQWDAKGLAGVFPVGTRLLYHSPATAGIIAWTMLAPFRHLIQSLDPGIWRKDSGAKPRPCTAHMQLMLFQMRHMKKDELYVRLDNVIHEITRSGESFDSVKSFWETWRRTLEMEIIDDSEAQRTLLNIFGDRAQIRNLPILPVKDVMDFQDSASKAFENASYKGELPDFLPLTLQRQSFDSTTRQWRLHHDRVKISEDVDLSKQTSNEDDKFTLYGFIVHDGERTSGKFFSVLRPNGPKGKWLVFSDGNGNKVFSYTRKQIDAYEGLIGSELKKAANNRQTIHTAMYIRTTRLSEYLTDGFEPFKLPAWLKPHLDETYDHDDEFFTPAETIDKDVPIPVELFWDKSICGQEGKLDLYKLKSYEKARRKENRQTLTVDREASISDIKARIATMLEVDTKAFKLWAMNHHRLGGVSKGYMYVLPDHSVVRSCLNTSLHLALWFTMVPEKCELEADVLANNFLKIDGTHIEAPPQPEPVEEAVPPVNEPNQANTVTDVEGATDANDSTPGLELAAADEEQLAIEEAIARSLEMQSATEASASADDNTTALPNPETVSVSNAAPDEEQTSVHDAVQQTVDQIGQSFVQADQPSNAVLETEARSSEVITDAAASSSATVANTENVQSLSNVFEQIPAPIAESSISVADLLRDVPPAPPQNLPVTPPEQLSSITPPSGDEATGSASIDHDSLLQDLLHGDPQLTLTESPETPLSHGEPPLPIGVPIAVAGDRVLLVQPSAEDISAEDAAMISSLIAADLEVAERGAVPGTEDASNPVRDDDLEIENEVVEESRPTTPRQHVPEVYGFLHVFDAENQKFIAHGTFMVPRDTSISAAVRKQMGYDDEESFHLWKRDGTYRTVGISLESTFQDASLTDCCEVIVGEHLGETKIESLKAEAKYVDPGHLMRYLAMVQRGHPVSALTSLENVEINEFGGDYYKGPYVRGQRHGKACHIITQAGDTYEGPLVAGQKSGRKGKMTYQNGDVYDGEWSDDQKHGQGEFVEKRTGNKYVGGYENDKRWGKGVTYWEQADQQAALCQVCYFEEVDALFYKCGHVVACYSCAKQCAADSNGCPVCRKPIEAVVKMYRS